MALFDSLSEEIFPYVQLGCRLIELLLESAFVQVGSDRLEDTIPVVQPAFRHMLKHIPNEDGYDVFIFACLVSYRILVI